jgi:1-acylglycerone phosphate reductase
MAHAKRTVLITGCSDGGLGAALAIAFHKAGLHVYATARNPSKMKSLIELGIETLTLDVQSSSSIADCVSKVSKLDILVNNAGAIYNRPFSDLSIPEAKKLFDLNVWSYLEVAQAFLPLLLKSKGMIVNQTSVASVVTLPFQSAYNASKAAMAMFSDSQRLELKPFGITVVDLKTGNVQSNIIQNHQVERLPDGSIYELAREVVEKSIGGRDNLKSQTSAEQWAEQVVRDLLKTKPPHLVWRGGPAWQTYLVRLGLLLPVGTLDGEIKKFSGLDRVEQIVGKTKGAKID